MNIAILNTTIGESCGSSLNNFLLGRVVLYTAIAKSCRYRGCGGVVDGVLNTTVGCVLHCSKVVGVAKSRSFVVGCVPVVGVPG